MKYHKVTGLYEPKSNFLNKKKETLWSKQSVETKSINSLQTGIKISQICFIHQMEIVVFTHIKHTYVEHYI